MVRTAHSMTARLRRVLLVEPGPMAADALERAGWLPMDATALRAQFHELHEILEAADVTVEIGGPSPPENPDAIYAYDGVMITRAGAIGMRSGKDNRRNEATRRLAELAELGIPELGRISPPGMMDGGDTLWLRDDLLAIGLSHRTNLMGAQQMAELVKPLGVEARLFDLPDYRGPDFCLHLMSLISLVSDHLAVVYRPLIPVRLLHLLADLGVELIDATSAEFERLGTNILSLGDERVIVASGAPRLREALRARDFDVTELDAPDLCHAGTGGPTCLTRPLWRQD